MTTNRAVNNMTTDEMAQALRSSRVAVLCSFNTNVGTDHTANLKVEDRHTIEMIKYVLTEELQHDVLHGIWCSTQLEWSTFNKLINALMLNGNLRNTLDTDPFVKFMHDTLNEHIMYNYDPSLKFTKLPPMVFRGVYGWDEEHKPTVGLTFVAIPYVDTIFLNEDIKREFMSFTEIYAKTSVATILR